MNTFDCIQEIDHHNAGGRESFYVVRFQITDDEKAHNMLAIVFDTPSHIAVFDMDLLAEGILNSSQNSWCGDDFEDEIRNAIQVYEAEQRRKSQERPFLTSHTGVEP